VGQDVPPTHWAYAAIQDLARKGLIQGYPPHGDFLGGRTLTRYEMANLLKRVVARMEALLQSGSAAERQTLQGSAGQIRELVNQFKLELTVIGTDMEKVKADLSQLKTQIGQQQNQIQALTQRVDAAAMAADQARTGLEAFQSQVNAALAKKVDVATGRLRISGLIQIWYGTAFGDTLGGNVPTNTSPVPHGRNYGGGVGDTFRLRRGQIILDGSFNPRLDYRVMFDLARMPNPLRDLVLGYQFAPHWRIEVGQQKTGLSEEGTRSARDLKTISRAVMNEDLPLNVGRVGAVRDTGIALRYGSAPFRLLLGIWNDNGLTEDRVDIDRFKFFSYAAYLTLFRHLTLGVWGGTNVGTSSPRPIRDRFGVTFLWQSGPHFFESELALSRDSVPPMPGFAERASTTEDAYFLYAYRFSRQWEFVIRYENINPFENTRVENEGGLGFLPDGTVIRALDHKLKEYTLGFTYYLNGNNAKIQLNYVREDVEIYGPVFFGKPRNILLVNYQAAF